MRWFLSPAAARLLESYYYLVRSTHLGDARWSNSLETFLSRITARCCATERPADEAYLASHLAIAASRVLQVLCANGWLHRSWPLWTDEMPFSSWHNLAPSTCKMLRRWGLTLRESGGSLEGSCNYGSINFSQLHAYAMIFMRWLLTRYRLLGCNHSCEYWHTMIPAYMVRLVWLMASIGLIGIPRPYFLQPWRS